VRALTAAYRFVGFGVALLGVVFVVVGVMSMGDGGSVIIAGAALFALGAALIVKAPRRRT
jgi:hypothetical protein